MQGIDDPDRLLVARHRVVAELDLFVGLHRLSQVGQVRGLPQIDPQPAPVAQNGLELVQARGPGNPRGSAPGTASMARAAVARAKPSAAVRRRGRASSGPRLATTSSLVDHDLHELVRRVRGQAAAGGQFQIGDQFVGTDAEALGQLGHRCPPLAGQPGEDGEETVEPVAGVGPGRHLDRPPRWPSRRGFQPGDHVGPDALGGEHLGVLAQFEDP